MYVSVFGLGYVGCVTAACLAKAGHHVIGVDVNDRKVAMISDGTSPVIEPGLGDLLADGVRRGRLKATVSSAEAIEASDLALVCVGTPGDPYGQIDLGALRRVGHEIGRTLAGRTGPYTVVLRSTAVPGTAESVLVPALRAGFERRAALTLRVAVNPEFMREGTSIRDFHEPPLTLVGCEDITTVSQLRMLYNGIDAPFVHTSIKAAEMIKYVSNAFHALKICFANEMGALCDSFGIDAHEVMGIFRMDRKLNISSAYLRPGFAFGGSCLPKDLRALLCAARTAQATLPLLSAILPSNDQQFRRGAEAVLATRRRRVGVVGLSFKPGTDDLRESPLVGLVEHLIGKGCVVRVLDHNVRLARLVGANRVYIEQEIPHITSIICDDADALIEHAEVLVIGTEGEEAAAVLALRKPDQIVIDLTRGVSRPKVPTAATAVPYEVAPMSYQPRM